MNIGAEPQTHTHRTYIRDGIHVEKNAEIKMRDGTILRMDIYRPADWQARTYPIILTRTPYSKTPWHDLAYPDRDSMIAVYGEFDANDLDWFPDEDAAWVENGFIRVRQDMRGRFSSDGHFVPGGHMLPEGLNDAYDTIEALAQIEGSSGKVGMIGASYDASTSWGGAFSQAPSLRAICPIVGSSSSFFEMTLFGGPAYYAFLVTWVMVVAEDIVARSTADPETKAAYAALLQEGRANPDKVLAELPVATNRYFDFDEVRELYQSVLLAFNPNFTTEPYKSMLDGMAAAMGQTDLKQAMHFPYELADVAVMNVNGWYDYSPWSQFKNLTEMQKRAKSNWARASQHVLIGPWDHPGFCDFDQPLPVAPRFISMRQNFQDFFAHYLKDEGDPPPKIRYFTMGSNQWEAASSWPLPTTQNTSLYLREGGALTVQEPGDEAPSTYIYDPADPTPSHGGRHQPVPGINQPGPREQSKLAERSDILYFDTDILSDDVTITGEISVTLYIASSVTDTDFVAQLIDVHPDGTSYNMADGGIHTRFHDSVLEPKPLTPGVPVSLDINLAVLSHTFKKGHRIRLHIASANYPAWSRNMNTRNPDGTDAVGIVAVQTVLHDNANPSHITLPLVKGCLS